MIFCRIRLNSDVRFERAYCWPRKGPKQDLWGIRCTGALLMYAAVAIIPATSSLSQTRPIFHGVRKYIAYSTGTAGDPRKHRSQLSRNLRDSHGFLYSVPHPRQFHSCQGREERRARAAGCASACVAFYGGIRVVHQRSDTMYSRTVLPGVRTIIVLLLHAKYVALLVVRLYTKSEELARLYH